MDLFEEITRLTNQLDMSVKQLRKSGTDYAQAEQDYKVCLRQEALKLRADENMPVTLINQIIYGVPEVARLRFERDVKEAVYDANKEAINTLKLKLRIIERTSSKRMEYNKMIVKDLSNSFNPVPKNKRIVNQKLIDDKKYNCEYCGKKNCYTNKHHIITKGSGGNDTEDNLIELCGECHRKCHDGKISKEELLKIIKRRNKNGGKKNVCKNNN